jgi:hypothetical protein
MTDEQLKAITQRLDDLSIAVASIDCAIEQIATIARGVGTIPGRAEGISS